MTTRQALIPWHAFGHELPDLVHGNRLLIAFGMGLQATPFFDEYFSLLQQKNLVRLKTSAEIEAAAFE